MLVQHSWIVLPAIALAAAIIVGVGLLVAASMSKTLSNPNFGLEDEDDETTDSGDPPTMMES